ncbi:MAG: hypothetical protein JSV70_08080 [bacterium]|nr:MAG: hypothetical protein JSV70_08080 [bacterium]
MKFEIPDISASMEREQQESGRFLSQGVVICRTFSRVLMKSGEVERYRWGTALKKMILAKELAGRGEVNL